MLTNFKLKITVQTLAQKNIVDVYVNHNHYTNWVPVFEGTYFICRLGMEALDLGKLFD